MGRIPSREKKDTCQLGNQFTTHRGQYYNNKI
jgi:hypothetical protein